MGKIDKSLEILKKLASEGKFLSKVSSDLPVTKLSMEQERLLKELENAYQMVKSNPKNNRMVVIDHNGIPRIFDKTTGKEVIEGLPEQLVGNKKSIGNAALTGAIGAGIIGATNLINPDEAEAAGIETIARKLGVTREVAQEIKTMASKVPPDLFEQNIKAIQDVARFKKDPKAMQELGRGIDVVAHDAGDNVIKVPRRGPFGKSWSSERTNIIPSVVEETGLGPKTKTVQTSGNKYQVQEKLSPLDDLESTHPVFTNDKGIDELNNKRLELLFDSNGKRRNLTDVENNELTKVRQQIAQREADLFRSLNIPEEVIIKNSNRVDSDKIEEYLSRKFNQKAGSVVVPSDLHTGNIGLDKNNQIKILDTGNFMSLDKSKLTPAMKKRVIENYIALPEQKSKLIESLNEQPNNLTKAAAMAGAMTAASMSNPDEAEAGTKVIPRKEIVQLLLKSMEDEGLNINKVLHNAGITNQNAYSSESQNKLLDILGHLSLEKTGNTEDNVVKAIKQAYPEIDRVNPNMIQSSADLPEGMQGVLRTPTIGNIFSTSADPLSAQMSLNKHLDPYPVTKTGVGFHEGEHFRQQTLGNFLNQAPYPQFSRNAEGVILPTSANTKGIADNIKDNIQLRDELIDNYEKLTGRKVADRNSLSTIDYGNLVMKVPGGQEIYMGLRDTKLDTPEYLNRVTRQHHGSNVKNYELEKIKELSDKGLITPSSEQIDKNIADNVLPESKRFTDRLNKQPIKKAAAIAPITMNLQEPMKQISDAYSDYVQKPISNIANKVATNLVEGTSFRPYASPDLKEPLKQAEETSIPIVQGATEMALDPLNWVDPIIGIPASIALSNDSENNNNDIDQRRNAIEKLRKP